MSNYHNTSSDLYLRPLPFLDSKWLRADLISSLRNNEDAAVLWNHLIQDCELVSSSAQPVLNANGDLSYLGDDGKHYCGAQRLTCACCQSDYCGPVSACNCKGCRPLDSDVAIKKLTTAAQQAAANENLTTNVIFDTWQWSQTPNLLAKKECQRMLVSELHELSLRAAGKCLSAQHLRQQLLIYERYFVALVRSGSNQITTTTTTTKKGDQRMKPTTTSAAAAATTTFDIDFPTTTATTTTNATATTTATTIIASNTLSQEIAAAVASAASASNGVCSGVSGNGIKVEVANIVDKFCSSGSGEKNNEFTSINGGVNLSASGSRGCGSRGCGNITNASNSNERAALDLARVGTRAALNFSFAFLRRAWRSGEDMELCSELLSEALESLQELPEATLFEASAVSPLWLEVLERSIKFLRLVALGDPMGGRCVAPLGDRHTALCLLLELGAQKGTLAATLESVVLLLMLWDKEKSTNDNREMPQQTGAPLVPILQRYKRICKQNNNSTSAYASTASATATFLRFLMLPRQKTAIVDLKKAAVVIMSHLDRLAKPHLPNCMILKDLQAKYDTNNKRNILINSGVNEGYCSLSGDKVNVFNGANSNSNTNNPTITSNNPNNPHASTSQQLELQEQRVYALGWNSLTKEQYGFTCEPTVILPGLSQSSDHYLAPILNVNFQVKQVACSEELVIFLTQDGKLYNWRIAKPEMEPTLIEEVADVEFISVAAHCEGRHYLALDTIGNIYSWGVGDNGRLGLGDNLSREFPTKITGLGRLMSSVHCGCSYSASITCSGALFTWGRGTYGRLGHGNSDDKFIPTHVTALDPQNIRDVALGSGDAHTICCTEEGAVYAWGDGDYGKLGNGTCNSSLLPILIETLPKIRQVYACANFSAALSYEGKIFTWGKSNYLGHEQMEQVYTMPKPITALRHKTIMDISLGVSHFLALSNSGEVFGWGRNDFQQICPASITKEPLMRTPVLVTHPKIQVCGIACTASQSIIWSQTISHGIPMKIPFVIDLNEATFRFLDQLLGIVCSSGGGQDINNMQTPDQESECIAVSCLNLIRLQLVALKLNEIDPKTVGLLIGGRLLSNLKSRILNLAGGMNVLKTIQLAAQWALQDGWSILLPTPAERAQTLTSLLPSEPGNSSSGHRFMTDLLVSSLMAEGGLESALNQAISSETIECNNDSGHNLPLLHLITRLLSNNLSLTQTYLNQLLRLGMRSNAKGILNDLTKHEHEDVVVVPAAINIANLERSSPSLSLLHRFQRLLLSKIHQNKSGDSSGAETLLLQYLHTMVPLCVASLQKAHEVALQNRDGVADVMMSDISDTLLYELLIGLILIKRDRPLSLMKLRWTKVFLPLLHALDNLNRVICDSDLQDSDDMGWPGIICRGGLKGSGASNQHECETQLIRKIDIENHIIDGGRWIILSGYVCDIMGYISDNDAANQIIEKGIGEDLTGTLNTPAYRSSFEYILLHHKIGKYASGNYTDDRPVTLQCRQLTHFNSECALSFSLGLVSNLMVCGPPLQPAELQCKNLHKTSMLSGGLLLLQPSNPFDEEKGEARSCASTAGNTPTEPPLQNLANYCGSPRSQRGKSHLQQRIDTFISGLAEARLAEPLVNSWIVLTERYCKEYNLIWHQDFPVEHPVQELERLLTAVLIRHQSLGGTIIQTLDAEDQVAGGDDTSNVGGLAVVGGELSKPQQQQQQQQQLPKEVSEIIRLVYQSKWSVVRTRQQLNRSYKEVCAPIIERLRFLLYEVRPAISPQQRGFQRLPLLHRLPRFKQLVRKFIVEMRTAKKQLACAKPEDILNVTIQSQNVASKLHHSHESLLQHDDIDSSGGEYLVAREYPCMGSELSSTVTATMVIMPPLRQNESNENLIDNEGDNSLLNNSERKLATTTTTTTITSTTTTTSANNEHDIKLQATELIYEDKKPEESETKLKTELMRKLSEKIYFRGELNTNLMHDIVDFAMQDTCDVETVRRAMYCQMQRYKMRLSGLETFQTLLGVHGLLDAAQYNLLNGFLGLHLKHGSGGGGGGSSAGGGASSSGNNNANNPSGSGGFNSSHQVGSIVGTVSHVNAKHVTTHILKNLNMITAYQKAHLTLAQSQIIEWAVAEIKRLVNKGQTQVRSKYHGGLSGGGGVGSGTQNSACTGGINNSSCGSGRETTNLGTYVFLKKLPRARFLLSIFGLLAKELGPNELSLIINTGLLGTMLGLLAQTGGDLKPNRSTNLDSTVVYEETILKQKSNRANLTGPELTKLMKIGTRIVRGADWKWGDQDGNPPGEGRIISEVGDDGWVRVEWYTGATNSYRMGKEGQYDLQLADSTLNVVSPSETDKEIIYGEVQPTSESHPTKLLRYCSTKLLQVISVGSAMHSEFMDKHAVRGLTSMFRAILAPNPTLTNISNNATWINLGFIKAISSDSKTLSKHLSSTSWINFYLELLEQPTACERDLYRKIHCLRLLQCVLVHWSEDNNNQQMSDLVRQLFETLGTLALYCPNDITLGTRKVKPRVLLSASHTGTTAEELITLLRRLHTLPYWNAAINSFLAQKICVAAELVAEETFDTQQHLESEYIFVMSVLSTIGGFDLRPRIGLNCYHEADTMTISGFTDRGKCRLVHNNLSHISEFSKVTLGTVLKCSDYTTFSLSRLPMNEMLLNAWAVLLFGFGECKERLQEDLNSNVLRLQQLQLALLNTNCILYRHQAALRRILKQRAPRSSRIYSSEESDSDNEVQRRVKLQEGQEQQTNEQDSTGPAAIANNTVDDEDAKPTTSAVAAAAAAAASKVDVKKTRANENELLVQSILMRATQPSPIKACYNYSDLAVAALNCLQTLASQAYTDLCEANSQTAASEYTVNGQQTATIIHGEPLYNVSVIKSAIGCGDEVVCKAIGGGGANAVTDAQLIEQIIEMGFTRKSVEFALKQLTFHRESIPTPEQIVQWILEHPDVCANTIEPSDFQESDLVLSGTILTTKEQLQTQPVHIQHDPEADSDNESVTSSSDTVEGSSIQDQSSLRFMTRKDFQSPDQYALYVRGLVCPGMVVRCCRDFEEIKKGDIGNVLIVDTEGLHDLNVQVDWQNHGNTYWVCFVHIELVELPRDKVATQRLPYIAVGARVRLRPSLRFNWTLQMRVGRSIGCVVAIKGKEVIVDFPELPSWKGSVNEVELVSVPNQRNLPPQQQGPPPRDLIRDWSRCIRSLSVSSNESAAKHLLDGSTNCWQSTSSSQGKHWIRLEMHDHILIHSLVLEISPEDHSHMPSLVEVRVGECLDSLKEYNWFSLKPNTTRVQLMTDVRDYLPWIEIVIKQCQNNGIQCKVHGIEIVGRRKQNDIDLLLMNATFLACEYNNLSETGGTFNVASNNNDAKPPANDVQCTVMVWGLNDKEQLGGLKGSKVKVPTFSQTISRLRPIHISGGSKSLFVVSQDGKVYACGEGTNGRLGLGVSHNVSMPHQVLALHQYVVKKVAVHSGGKHALALTLDGRVFSWGEGEDGKLGHGNRLTMDKPKLIETLRSKKIRDIACGSSHSAAITSAGELYTWGLGEYGRLGHGDNATQMKPKLVQALVGKHVIQVACGSRDAQTLALTEDGTVYSWGDGDFGKLGRGGSEGSAVPHEIERLNGIGVIQIECGAQFSLALTRTGEVWTWGKGDYYRLGHGNDQHVRKPQPIQGLRGRRVIHVAVGALHCLAVTESGQVYAWGDNDHGQQGSGNTFVNKKPAMVIGLDSVFANRVACGSSHSIAWGLPNVVPEEEKKGPVPFTTTRDPLGGSSLGIYDGEPSTTQVMAQSVIAPPPPSMTTANSVSACANCNAKKPTGLSFSESVLALESPAARQAALNYLLKAMNIMQARQLIIAALTSHSKVNFNEKQSQEMDNDSGVFKDLVSSGHATTQSVNGVVPGVTLQNHQQQSNGNEVIAQGGGEAPADASDPALQEVSPDGIEGILPTSAGLLSAFQSLNGSLSMSASLSSSALPQKQSKMSASAMSVIAATIANHEEMIEQTSLTGLDDFTSMFGEPEAKSLIDLLKLSVCGRCGSANSSHTIADTLISLGVNSPTIGAMLLETCITELEDLCTSRYCLGKVPKPIMQESSHPYVDNVNVAGHVKISGAEMLRLEFDSQCSTEKRNDPLVIMDSAGRVVAMRSGREFAHWAPEIRIPGEEMRWKFSSDSSVNGWGWRFWVHAIMPATTLNENGSDRAVLSQPSMALVMALLDQRLSPKNTSVLLRLAAALSTCSQLGALSTAQRIWALKKLHAVLLLENAPKPLDVALKPILFPLISELLRQYEYEEPQVRGGIHLMHSDYFKTLAALACDMQLDSVLPTGDVHKWAWFKRYCIAVRVAQSLIKRTELPKAFCLEVRKKFTEMLPQVGQGQSPVPGASLMNSTTSLSSSTTSNPTPPPSLSSMPSAAMMAANGLIPNSSGLIQYIDSVISNAASETGLLFPQAFAEQASGGIYEDHTLFKGPHDAQLLQWLNRRPDDWALSWGGASTIYGWGHNHRGQLGGLEGSRIKTPTPCEALSLLRPVQLAGGEQTLFAVTPDGKLFATGYGSGGRLGVGGTDSWAIPTLIGSLQHVFIKKVAVNSGGKHCLALTTEGEVYSWGEGEDGKLGHGNRMSFDRPKLIEDLNGMAVVDIACGSAHSAAITSSGHVLTWGKGRYGRLGHGDSEDQLRPKLVEALLGYRANDIACGSGDAQTLCITDDDNVWSWGDGDYGKLGRGGSDGCKVPFKIESLAGLGVVKVECGSQFSVALTKSGAVYTWGKGDFHRLGHGTVDHVRRPKKVGALQGKKIISIATGSLHCVACSDTGEVYTWGDNDEGQLGDGTVTAIQRPRLVTALQGKHIVKVTCGSAHTLALSTSQLSERLRPLPNPPLEYDLVRDLPPEALHARLILLHHFSELLCPCLAMLPISGELSLGSLKDVLVYNIKEAAFRKVIQTTMVRDKQHGPVIELNRIQVKRSRNKCSSGLAGVDGMKSVFGQMVQKLPLLTQEALSLPHRVWKVKFVGESVDDCGGGYSESIAEMCDELQNGSVPLLINTPNGRGEAGANRDCFLLDPTLTSVLQMNMFRFLGVLMGIAVRTGSPLSINLAEPVWRQLTGEPLRPSDLTEVDRDYVAGLLCIRNMEDDPKVFNTLELPFTTSSARGHEVPLSTRYTRILPKNRHEYVRLALNFRLHEFDEQVKAVRDGMSKVIPVPLLSLFSASELQAMVCGSPDIPLGLLKSVATYKGFDPLSPLVLWFWEVMEEFSNQERSLFLRFVWGRTRLPRTIADFRGRDFVLQVLEKNPPDHFLPESYTCFFLLKMPRYSCKAVLLEKLKYAIHFCKSIDTDEYARVAMGDPTEITGSEDNSDIDSVTSHDN